MNNLEKVDSILDKYSKKKQVLIPALQEIQAELNWLPQDVLATVAQKLGIPLRDIYGVATFFKSFSLKPRGKHIITACLGTACHVRGGPRIADEISRLLNISPGETTKDMQFTLETVNCLGCCAIGPIIVIDGEYYGGMTTRKVDAILKSI